MTTTRGALALAAVLFVRTAGAEPCAPRAALDGDAAAVARVAVELQRLGVSTDVRAGDGVERDLRCPTLVAAVELDRGGGIAVAVSDRSHRSEGRVVSDAALAAAWIDSWLRDDFEPAAMVTSSPSTVPPVEVVAPTASRPGVFDRMSIAASFDQIWSGDGARWSGMSVSSCARVGAVCLGGRLGYATQDLAGDATLAIRSDLFGLATASTSQQIGRMWIAPELGIGLGRMTTQRIDGCAPAMAPACDPMVDPTCPQQPPPIPCKTDPSGGIMLPNDHLAVATITPRVEAAVRIALPLFDRVWLDGLVGVGYAPLGHSESYPLAGAMPNAPSPSTPGEPSTSLRFGLGLRVGLP